MTNIQETIKKAKELKKEQKFEDGIKVLEELFQKEPQSDEIKEILIDILFSYGANLNDDYVAEHDKAIEIFKRIIEIDPMNYRGFYNLGISYFNLGLYEEALKSYNEAIRIKSDYEYCYYNIGLLYEAQNNLREALSYYNKALELEPKFAYAQHSKEIITRQIELLKNESIESEDEIICENCGNINRSRAHFCDKCGTKL
jgi:tetratricopeptide (TPR) repeat protein